MAKGIIVVDVPDSCELCKFSGHAYDSELFREGEMYCTVNIKSVENIAEGVKPERCPIRPIPEKMEVCGRYPQPDRIVPSYKIGWNACVDEMLKGEEK